MEERERAKKEKQEREEQEAHKQERERQFLEWQEQEKRQARERKRREKEQQLSLPSVTNHQEDGGRGDEEETEDDDPDWLTKLSEIQEKCAGCCFLAQQVLKIQTELEKELARKQYKGKVNTVVAIPTLSQGTTVCSAYRKYVVIYGTKSLQFSQF